MNYNEYVRVRSAERIGLVGKRISLLGIFPSFVGWLSVTVTAGTAFPVLFALCLIALGYMIVYSCVFIVAFSICLVVIPLEWLFAVPKHKRTFQ